MAQDTVSYGMVIMVNSGTTKLSSDNMVLQKYLVYIIHFIRLWLVAHTRKKSMLIPRPGGT